MARRTTVELIDDIDGGAAAETIEFSVNGKAWAIDLNAENAQRFYDELEQWQKHARRAGAARTSSPARKRDPEHLAKIRTWARENGYEVSDRGRISRKVESAYHAAQH